MPGRIWKGSGTLEAVETPQSTQDVKIFLCDLLSVRFTGEWITELRIQRRPERALPVEPEAQSIPGRVY